jgi:2-amino-4-hydroxy-6-hydroxymethyldihydropteridine diphosphokinase
MTIALSAFIGLGGNLGDAAGTVQQAIGRLEALPDTQLARASRRYRTPAWGNEEQPPFVNAVAWLRTGLSAPALLQALLAVEGEFGRERDNEQRWGPRTLDLDLLLYGDQVIDQPGLQVPHPYLTRRAFVLVPLAEIAPQLVIPGAGTVRDALLAVDSTGVEPLGG